MQHLRKSGHITGADVLKARQRLLTALPKRTASAAVRDARYTADWASQCRESRLRTDTHLPYTVLVQRWWRSTLGGRVARRGHFQVTVGAAAPGVTFFGATWHSVSGWLLLEAVSEGSFCRCKVDLCAGLRIQKARRGPGSFLQRQRQSVMRRDKIYKYSDSSRLSNQNERSLRSRDAPGVLLCACVSMCVETWTRLRCASPKLRRINAAFTYSRELLKRNLIRTITLKNCNFVTLQLLKYDL